MAILTAAELKASREAIEAGVSTVSDAAANQAISDSEAFLYRTLGYRIAVSDTTLTVLGRGVNSLIPTERVRTISGITEDGTAIAATTYVRDTDGWLLRRATTNQSWLTDKSYVITGTFGYATTEDKYILAKRVVLLLAVRQLQGNQASENFPTGPPGALLSSFTSDNTTFTFTPSRLNGYTPYEDVDQLIDRIGVLFPVG